MRLLTLSSALWIGAANFAHAQAILPCSVCKGVPAPSIGSGIPVALAAGAVLCGMMLVKRWRRS
jgi:hypothetical protein